MEDRATVCDLRHEASPTPSISLFRDRDRDPSCRIIIGPDRRVNGRDVRLVWDERVVRVAPAAKLGLELCPRPTLLHDDAGYLTTIPVWMPLIVLVTVSVAVTDCVPAVLRVTLKTWVPASVALNL